VLDSPEGPLARRLRWRLSWLALLVTIVIGFGPPGTYYLLEVRRLHDAARMHARDIAGQLAAGRAVDLAAELHRAPELLSIRIREARQTPIDERADRAGRRWWNAYAPAATAPVPQPSAATRFVEVATRQDYVLKTTAAFLALSSITAGVLAILLYVLPLAVVAQMEARNRRLEAEREALAIIERELTAELERDRLLRLIVDHASALFSGNGAIYLLDEQNKLVPRAWTDGGAFSDVHIPLGQGLVGTSAKERQALLIDDYPTSAYALPEFVAIGLRSAITQPLLIRDQVLGVIAMNRLGDKAHAFSGDDVERLKSFAAQAAIALENARLFAENRRQVETLSVLHELSRAVTGQLERTALVEAIGREVSRVPSVKEIFIVLKAGGSEPPVIALHSPEGRESIGPDKVHKLALMVLQARRLVQIDPALVGGEVAGVGPRETRAWLGLPMSGGNADHGMFLVAGDGSFTESDERLLTDIGQLAGLALSSARLFEERGQAYAELAAAQDGLMRAEKLRALGEMASGVAHDFNNLLAAICGRTQLLLGRVTDPVQQRWLHAIKRAADDGAQTVRRLQEFTRIRRDQPFVSVDLNEVIRGALEVTETRWSHEAESAGIVIAVETDLSPVPAISGDPVELREVMTNLILNAVDAMPEGGRLKLSSTVDDTEVEARIEDTGFGMGEEVRQRLFDPFFTTKGPRGTGLGLSITYGIVTRHGGRIVVDSELGRGSAFRLRFPKRSVVEEPEIVEPEPALTPVRPLRCLVVDDDEEVASVLGDMLLANGHEAVVVTKSTEALTQVAGKQFDIVFSDLAMPDLSGWQLARAVKTASPGMPVVLITGFGVELSPEQCHANHVDAVLTKPVELGELLKVATRLTQ
jgi:signal transduction histidine kinase